MSEVLGQPPQKKNKKNIKWGLTHERSLGSAPAKKTKKNIKFLIKNIIESFKDIGSG